MVRPTPTKPSFRSRFRQWLGRTFTSTVAETLGAHRIYPPPTAIPRADAPAARRWGFDDTRFVWDRSGAPRLQGNRYPLCGVALPALTKFARDVLGFELSAEDRHVPLAEPHAPERRSDPALERALEQIVGDRMFTDGPTRVRHGHGHTASEIYTVNYGRLARAPDIVVMPESTEEVAAIVRTAAHHEATCIPFGGGTSVTGALQCHDVESRIIISIDLARMSRVRWIDPVDAVACIQAGAVGRVIAEQLAEHGFTLGHEPDSIEFSTLGGWVATRASGMKRNRYGNIEQVVLQADGVTAAGEVGAFTGVPRTSHGIDPETLWFGSEGTLGVITEAKVRLHRLPEVQRYGSIAFPDFAAGVGFLYALTQHGDVPASVRLVDNDQLAFAQALKPAPRRRDLPLKWLQQQVLQRWHGFDLSEVSAATVVYEGSQELVERQQKTVRAIAEQFGGIDGGSSRGADGYRLTFAIAYIRDYMLEHWVWGESFETSVSWRNAMPMIAAVKQAIRDRHAELGLPGRPFVTSRISQIYPEGVCTYFYVGFVYKQVEDPSAAWHALEGAAREAMLTHGAAVSHHHGIGQTRTPWLHRAEDDGRTTLRRKLKQAVDPHDIFGVGNQGLSERS
ncbi:MAG: FAD-binding oxidoreductase [Myxococcota bacterium]